jgi:branched-subunit amino acid transport protein
MPPLTLWFVIVAMGALTYAMRVSVIAFLGGGALPDIVRRALRFVPPAVLAAIVLPELLLPGGAITAPLANPRLAAGLVAIGVAWRTKNVFLTIGVGIGVLWGLRLLR